MSWGFFFSVAFPALMSREEVLLFVRVAFTEFFSPVSSREGRRGWEAPRVSRAHVHFTPEFQVTEFLL